MTITHSSICVLLSADSRSLPLGEIHVILCLSCYRAALTAVDLSACFFFLLLSHRLIVCYPVATIKWHASQSIAAEVMCSLHYTVSGRYSSDTVYSSRSCSGGIFIVYGVTLRLQSRTDAATCPRALWSTFAAGPHTLIYSKDHTNTHT